MTLIDWSMVLMVSMGVVAFGLYCCSLFNRILTQCTILNEKVEGIRQSHADSVTEEMQDSLRALVMDALVSPMEQIRRLENTVRDELIYRREREYVTRDELLEIIRSVTNILQKVQRLESKMNRNPMELMDEQEN